MRSLLTLSKASREKVFNVFTGWQVVTSRGDGILKHNMPSKLAATNVMLNKLALGELPETTNREASFALLIKQARTGDATAFEMLMIRSQHKVARTAWRLLGNEEDARDAAQEVFLRAFKYLNRFDEEQDFDAWLYRITINVCRDLVRKFRHEAVSQVDLEHEREALEAQPSSDDTEAATLYAERRQILAQALATLTEKERRALALRDLEGLSTEEVARILKSRPATVRSQISMARRKIKLYCERLIHKSNR